MIENYCGSCGMRFLSSPPTYCPKCGARLDGTRVGSADDQISKSTRFRKKQDIKARKHELLEKWKKFINENRKYLNALGNKCALYLEINPDDIELKSIASRIKFLNTPPSEYDQSILIFSPKYTVSELENLNNRLSKWEEINKNQDKLTLKPELLFQITMADTEIEKFNKIERKPIVNNALAILIFTIFIIVGIIIVYLFERKISFDTIAIGVIIGIGLTYFVGLIRNIFG